MVDYLSQAIDITIRSLLVSSTATLLAAIWSIPLSVDIATRDFRGKKQLISFINAMVSVPTVILGLVIYMLLSNSGPLGLLHILYTPYAIIIGESILITPLMISISHDVLKEMKQTAWELAVSIGATEKQASDVMLREATPELITVMIISFGRALGELGVALMVGGNIKGYTRVFTTAIALEVTKGDFELALVLGVILLIIVVIISTILRFMGEKSGD